MSIFLEKDGKPIGKLYMAFIVDEDSFDETLRISSSHVCKEIIDSLSPGTPLRVASNNQECIVVSAQPDGGIKIDRLITSLDKEYLAKGDIIIIHNPISND